MRSGFNVLDADTHVAHPTERWPRFLDGRFVDRSAFETDYPGPDSTHPLATRHFRELGPELISEDSTRKILRDSGVGLHRFPPEYHP